LREVEVVIPNLHWRYSGVTATSRMIAPRVARVVHAAWLGRDAPDGLPRLTFGDLLRLRGLAATQFNDSDSSRDVGTRFLTVITRLAGPVRWPSQR